MKAASFFLVLSISLPIVAQPRGQVFINAVVNQLLQVNQLRANNVIISGNLVVGGSILNGQISSGSSIEPLDNGDVSSASDFTADNLIVVTDLSTGVKNIKETVVTLDDSGNISGVGDLQASEVDADTVFIDSELGANGTVGLNTLNSTGTTTIGNASAGAITITTGTGNFTVNGSGHMINIGTDNAGNAIAIGNANANSAVTIEAGLGVGIYGLGAGEIILGSGNQTGSILIGNSTVGQTISIGNANSLGAQIINIGAGSSSANSTVNILSGTAIAGVQTLNVLTGGSGGSANIASGGAGAYTVVLGSLASTSQTTIQAGTNGLLLNAFAAPTINGNISVRSAQDSAAGAVTSVTVNSRVIGARFVGFTTGVGDTQDFTINSTFIESSSTILVTVGNSNVSTQNAFMGLSGMQQANGSLIISTINNGPGILGIADTIYVNVWILD